MSGPYVEEGSKYRHRVRFLEYSLSYCCYTSFSGMLGFRYLNELNKTDDLKQDDSTNVL